MRNNWGSPVKTGKRIFDIIASAIGMLILSPVFLLIALLIKIKMPGKVLFSQQRVGRYGKLFTLYKFRTMVQLHEGCTITIAGEKRITPFGAILRKYKLDELPELFNVLKGDMSFVGPRPDVPGYADLLQGEARKILELRPGITGPATVKFYNEEALLATVPDPKKHNDENIYPEKVRLNLDYYHNQSLSGDIRLIIQTLFRKY
jgi:lipopolysaccharide/colanic/teichoic acid biosynthesis glycosyltransferase